jgi:hypothetical protein
MAAGFMARGSHHANELCRLCATICIECAEDCERMAEGDEMMEQCASTCRECAKACETMVGATA